jgi:hypothetical protein
MFVINSCRKTDRPAPEVTYNNELEQKFFNSHASSNPMVRSITSFVKGQNNKYHFVENLVKQIGFPYWDKAITISNSGHWGRGSGINEDSANITYISFVRDTQNHVNASLKL